jgi:hypothetical protein
VLHRRPKDIAAPRNSLSLSLSLSLLSVPPHAQTHLNTIKNLGIIYILVEIKELEEQVKCSSGRK